MDVQKIFNEASQRVMGPPHEGIIDGIHDMYTSFGLKSPILRGAVTFGAVWAFLHWLKPAYWYMGDEIRPWSYFSDDEEARPLTIEMVAGIVGILAAGV